MEQRVSLREVNQHLTRYVKAAESGQQIVITRRGRPVALLSGLPRGERPLTAEQEKALERILSRSAHLGGKARRETSFMSAERVTFDTNILFYAADADAGKRRERARDLLARAARQHN